MPRDSIPTPRRVLVVAAHPDDIEFGAAGTVARWIRDGASVEYLLLTRGDKGTSDPAADPASVAARREAEQRAAAEALGVSAVEFLGERDGEVEVSLTLRGRVTYAIRRTRPDVVMTHDPTVLFVNNEWVNHPDHRATGELVVDAVFPSARDPLNLPEHLAAGLEPWKVGELYLWATNEANRFVDIDETLDAKLDALARHASQFDDWGEIERWMRARAHELGERAGYPAAEAFRRVVLAR